MRAPFPTDWVSPIVKEPFIGFATITSSPLSVTLNVPWSITILPLKLWISSLELPNLVDPDSNTTEASSNSVRTSCAVNVPPTVRSPVTFVSPMNVVLPLNTLVPANVVCPLWTKDPVILTFPSMLIASLELGCILFTLNVLILNNY